MLAEREGFEPPVEFPPQWFSRPPPSTTRPSLRGGSLANLALFGERLLVRVSLGSVADTVGVLRLDHAFRVSHCNCPTAMQTAAIKIRAICHLLVGENENATLLPNVRPLGAR